jgi:Fe-S cluster assembly scaffold protein SufB
MLSRGISREKAQQLLIFAFLEEVLTKIENHALSDSLREMIEQKLNKGLSKE